MSWTTLEPDGTPRRFAREEVYPCRVPDCTEPITLVRPSARAWEPWVGKWYHGTNRRFLVETTGEQLRELGGYALLDLVSSNVRTLHGAPVEHAEPVLDQRAPSFVDLAGTVTGIP